MARGTGTGLVHGWLPEFEDLTESEKEAIRARLPKDGVERLQIYRALLVECRDFLSSEAGPTEITKKLGLSIDSLERAIRRKAN
jgi:DNA-binding phage protein